MNEANEVIFTDEDDIEGILKVVLDRALKSMVKGVESGNVEVGMIAKNLEVDQAVIIAINLDYFTQDEVDQYMKECFPDQYPDPGSKIDKLISDTKRSNQKIGFIIRKIKAKKPEVLHGVI